MSLIVAEVYEALIEAGASKEKAKAAASAIPLVERLATREVVASLEKQMATKADIAGLAKATKADIAGLAKATKEDIAGLAKATKEDIAGLAKATKEDIASLAKATKADIAGLAKATKEDIANSEKATREDIARLDKVVTRMDKKLAVLNLAVFSFIPAALTLLVKLVFFP